MANEWVTIVEEATAGTDPGSGYTPLPVTGNLQPKYVATDEPRAEFRNSSTALGAVTVRRKESMWEHTLDCAWYPDNKAIGILFKHLLGYAATRSTVDTSAYEGLLYPVVNAFSSGGDLEGQAIGLTVNSDESGTTKAQYWGGAYVTGCTLKAEGTDDWTLSFTLKGAGGYVGAADQTAQSTPTFSSVAPFVSSDALCYIGSGIDRTGTAPDFTALAAGTMDSFLPDSLEITITNGLDLKTIMNGVAGPSKIHRSAMFDISVSAPMDYDDPASGFSSAAEFKSLFTAVQTNNIFIALANGEVAGDTTTEYGAVIDLPNLMVAADAPERNTEGVTPTVGFTFKSLFSETAEYPVALLTTDKNSAY